LAAEVAIDAALAAVRAAIDLCRRTQGRLLAGDTLTKGDDSPVTVADFAAQAVVSATLVAALGPIDMIGEEDAADLGADHRTSLRDGVVELVRSQLGGDVEADQVLEWISVGGSDGTADRYWTLDPIDGTKGFLRGDQYAIALALIDHGKVVLGVLGCPNLTNLDGSVGAIFVAAHDRCDVHAPSGVVPARVCSPPTIAAARLCESVEPGHSDQTQSARVAALLGITAAPYRIDSQCKYGAVARGDASIYLRLPTRPDYREKVWDHAAGAYLVERAGGRVTDVSGAPLDFSHGRLLVANRGVIASDGSVHDEVLAAVQQVLGEVASSGTV
jgi:3'(2'), 5'-bisphosphate nucleotidase